MAKARRVARDANAAIKARQAIEMRKVGHGYDEIAAQCGYAERGAAYRAVQRELARTLQQPADDVRKMEVERLDALLLSVMPIALKGELGSVDRVLRIMERRARLLGLDAVPEAPQGAQVLIREYPAGLAEAV